MTYRSSLPSIAVAGGLAITLLACSGPNLHVLHGEDSEIAQLLERPLPATSQTSSLAAARRLHQAIVQSNGEMTWALLATQTRRALDARGATIGTSGRELIDGGLLPTVEGSVVKVQYATLFFGPQVEVLRMAPRKDQSPKRQIILAKSKAGSLTTMAFVLEEDGWKLDKSDF